MEHYKARSHSGDAVRLGLPPLELLEPHIDRTTDQAHAKHWYWDGEFVYAEWLGGDNNPRPQDALFCWKVPGVGRGRYIVIRVLLHHTGVPLPPRSSVLNMCGLVTCVNPSHWQVVTLGARAQPAVPDPYPRRSVRHLPRGNRDDCHCCDPYRWGLTLCNRELDPTPGADGVKHPLLARSRREGVTCARCILVLSENPGWPIPP